MKWYENTWIRGSVSGLAYCKSNNLAKLYYDNSANNEDIL